MCSQPHVDLIDATDHHNFQLLITVLETDGRPSIQPFPTPSVSRRMNSTVSCYRNTSTASVKPIASAKANITIHSFQRRAAEQAMIDHTEVFQAVATSPPPVQIPSRGDHPVRRLNIVRPMCRCDCLSDIPNHRLSKMVLCQQPNFTPISS